MNWFERAIKDFIKYDFAFLIGLGNLRLRKSS